MVIFSLSFLIQISLMQQDFLNQGGNAQVRFQPRLGRYLAAAAENVVSILDTETQACRHSLKVYNSSSNYLESSYGFFSLSILHRRID